MTTTIKYNHLTESIAAALVSMVMKG